MEKLEDGESCQSTVVGAVLNGCRRWMAGQLGASSASAIAVLHSAVTSSWPAWEVLIAPVLLASKRYLSMYLENQAVGTVPSRRERVPWVLV